MYFNNEMKMLKKGEKITDFFGLLHKKYHTVKSKVLCQVQSHDKQWSQIQSFKIVPSNSVQYAPWLINVKNSPSPLLLERAGTDIHCAVFIFKLDVM